MTLRDLLDEVVIFASRVKLQDINLNTIQETTSDTFDSCDVEDYRLLEYRVCSIADDKDCLTIQIEEDE